VGLDHLHLFGLATFAIALLSSDAKSRADIEAVAMAPTFGCSCELRSAALSYVYYESEPGRRSAAKLLSEDDAKDRSEHRQS
jgi:hypothetical protein